MAEYTQEQREQAARVLDNTAKEIKGFMSSLMFSGEDQYQELLDKADAEIAALDTAIACLRGKGKDSVTITLPNNGMCAIVRKINGHYEIDTGRVEKWPEVEP